MKFLLQEAQHVITKTHFHSESIKSWALAIDKRYKDLACHMKQYRQSLEIKLGFPLPDDEEVSWVFPEFCTL